VGERGRGGGKSRDFSVSFERKGREEEDELLLWLLLLFVE
jgi:hypothetical protein